MLAISMGLAEVEQRLQVLRRRLNTIASLHAAFVSLTVFMLAAAGLLILGVRGSVSTFRVAAWAAALVTVTVLAAGVVFVWRRWLDLAATAHLADQRGQLTDRLATLVDLRLRPRPSLLAPVLLAQTLALGTRWHVQRIAPRRIPRSVFLLLAALLALAASLRIGLKSPPWSAATGPSRGEGAAAVEGASALNAPLAAGGDFTRSGEDQMGAAQELTNVPLADESLEVGDGVRAGKADPLHSKNLLASLPDRLRRAIRDASQAKMMDQPNELAAQQHEKGEPGERDETEGDGEAGRHSSSDRGESDSRSPSQKSQGSEAKAPEKGSGTESPKPGEQTGESRGQEGNAPTQSFEGASPAAGSGSSAGGLMAANPTHEAVDPGGPKTFKLRITSFLHAVEQKGEQPREGGKGAASSRLAARASGGGRTALSKEQQLDDALRKAEIPAEYEDIVRRVYSARAGQ